MIGLELAQKLYPHFHIILFAFTALLALTLCLGFFLMIRRYRVYKNIHRAEPALRAQKAREIHKEIKYLVELRDELDPSIARADQGREGGKSSENPHQSTQKSVIEKELQEKKSELNKSKSELEALMTHAKEMEKNNKLLEQYLNDGRSRIEKLEKNLETKLQEIVVLNKQLKEYRRIEKEVNMSDEERSKLEFSVVKKPMPAAAVNIEDYSKDAQESGEAKVPGEEDPLLEEFKKALKSGNE